MTVSNICVLASPSRYIQGPGASSKVGEFIKPHGDFALFLGGKRGLASIRQQVEKSCSAKEIRTEFIEFNGECCDSEIDRLLAIVKTKGVKIAVGCGGGKAIDTIKLVAHRANIACGIIPCIAATDAPCSALSVVYSSEGVFNRYEFLPKNPDFVLLDTEVIAKAPVRLLVSGMGDALATWFEAEQATISRSGNCVGGKSTLTAKALARLCFDTLLNYGVEAKIANESGVPTAAFEHVVEANTLLSGLGFESAGLCAAHAIHNGLTVLKDAHSMYHGEKVAFGTLVQLVLQDAPRNVVNEVLTFCKSVGLPVCLQMLGVKTVTDDELRKVAALSCVPAETIHNLPFKVDAEMVFIAIKAADALGKAFMGL